MLGIMLYLLILYVSLLHWEFSSHQFKGRFMMVILCGNLSVDTTLTALHHAMVCVHMRRELLFLSTLLAPFCQERLGLSERILHALFWGKFVGLKIFHFYSLFLGQKGNQTVSNIYFILKIRLQHLSDLYLSKNKHPYSF